MSHLLNNMSVVKTFRSSPYYYVIDIFHSLPHLNMWFALSNSTFDPNDYDYLETILFWSTACILLLIFILLILIIYACCLVVCTSNTSTIKLNSASSFSSQTRYFKKATNLAKYKSSVLICVVMLSVSLAAIVYGSEKFHHSFNSVTHNIRGFSNYFTPIGQQTSKVKDTLAYLINTTLVKYEKDLNSQINAKAATDSRKELYNIKQSLNESYMSLEPLNQFEYEKNAYNYFLKQLELSEQTRWAIMIGIVTGNMLLIVILIIGLFRNSKGSLCFFAFSGVLSLILVWILNAFYLAITVFFADYCSSPDQYILTVAEKNQMKNMVQYFTTCTSPSAAIARYSGGQQGKYAPFKHELNRANSKLRTALTLYNDNLVSMSRQVLGEESMAYVKSYGFQKTIELLEESLDKIRSMISCEQTSTSYKHAVNNLCTNSLLGLAIVVVSGFLFGLVIPILICIIPQMWRRMHAKDYFDYHQANSNGTAPTAPEESHPFLYTNGTSGGGPGNGHLRTTASAVARQFNESPSFQRLAINSSSINSNTTQTTNTNNNNSVIGMSNNLATISRNNRFNTMNQPRTNPYATNNNSLAAAAAAANSSLQSYSQTLKLNNTSRLMNDYLHQDPYLLLNSSSNTNNNGFPTAPNAPLPPPPILPPSNQNGNYFNTNNVTNIPKPPEYSKYNNSNNAASAASSSATYAASNALQSSSINVPIVLYPNYRTLSIAASRKYHDGNNMIANGNYHHHHIHLNPYGTLAKHL